MQAKQFVRDATGLVREYGALDTILFASVFVFALVFTIEQFPWFYGNTSGADLATTLLVAAIPFIFLMLAYWAIAVLMPRTGNDYVWVSRVFHPAIGFTWGLIYVLIVFLAAFIGAGTGPLSLAVSSIFSTAGLISGSSSLVNMGTYFGTPIGGFELAVLFTVAVTLFTIFGSKLIKYFLYFTWIFAIIGMITMWYILSTTSNATFVSNWNTLIGSTNPGYTYAALQNTAVTKGGWTGFATGFPGIIAALPFAFLFLFGGNYVNSFAGEIKNVRKSIPLALFLSLVLGLGYWILTSSLTSATVGKDWITQVGYAWIGGGSATGTTGYPLPYQPTQPLFLAVAAYPNQGLITFMYITYFIGSLGPVFAYFWIPSKYLFAFSFDRVIPSKFADVSEKFHTPYIAVITTAVIAILAEYLYSYLGYSSYFTMGTVLWGISYVVPGLALMVFPFVKKDLFATAPGWVGKKVAGIPLVSLVGLATAVGFGYVGYDAYSNPAITSPNFNSLALVGSLIVVGLVLYFVSKAYYRGKGIDISMALKEIPPE
ncbi:MAG TPA: APC family permease [Nitrososphaerales archaeon]|nr:APC family permease [Nitrososphaerales archaeon]